MSEISLDNIGHLDIEDEENPSSHPAAQPATRGEKPMPRFEPAPAREWQPLPVRQLPKSEVESQVIEAEEKFTDELRASFKLLEQINNLPEDTHGQRVAKNIRLEKIKAHCHRIQQGTPTPSRIVANPAAQTGRPGLVEDIRRNLLKKLGR